MKKLKAKCSNCNYQEEYILSEEESAILRKYECYGRHLGKIQELFPKIPAWIRSGAIDKTTNGFCICPNCWK